MSAALKNAVASVSMTEAEICAALRDMPASRVRAALDAMRQSGELVRDPNGSFRRAAPGTPVKKEGA